VETLNVFTTHFHFKRSCINTRYTQTNNIPFKVIITVKTITESSFFLPFNSFNCNPNICWYVQFSRVDGLACLLFWNSFTEVICPSEWNQGKLITIIMEGRGRGEQYRRTIDHHGTATERITIEKWWNINLEKMEN
jgi:hypothetical protein